MDAPRIRQVVFIVDKNSYQFDVNQTITIKSLKKMIISAANLGKNGLKVFHKGAEYSLYDESSIQDLFPNMQTLELTISIDYEDQAERDRDTSIVLKLGDYCAFHDLKYPYFYCYDCKLSFCSICLQSGEHRTHNYLEKYDYLQSSKNLVESMFHDLKDFLHSSKFDEKPIDEIKNKIKFQLVPTLTAMIGQIESKLYEVLDVFTENEKVSFVNMQRNVGLLKNHCAEGLDKLKNEISIEDIMINENIFLTFDNKFKEISNEKIRIMNDSKKFEDLKKTITFVTGIVDTIYIDIFGQLEKYLKSTIYNEIKTKIADNSVGTVNKEDIFTRILSGVERDKFRSRLTGETPAKRPYTHLKFDSHFKSTPAKEIIHNASGSAVIITQCIPLTRDFAVYDNVLKSITRNSVDFPSFLGISNIPPSCAYLNVNGKLYISGGLQNNAPSNSFIVYEPISGELTRLTDMITARHSHSMFFYNEFIFAVGGPQNTTEKYDIKNQKWIKLSSLFAEERLNPVLYVYKDYLYAFFGLSKGTYLDTVEKLNLKNVKAKWEHVPYKNTKNIDLKLIGCGIIPNKEKENEIFMFGGKYKDGLRNYTLKFDFSNNNFDIRESCLDDGIYFQESLLIDLGDNCYGHFNQDKYENFYKIQLE